MLFKNLRGQNFAKKILLNELSGDRVAATYLFFGPAGCGKKTAAYAYAAALLATDPTDPVSVETTARRIEAGNHADFRLWSPAGASFKVDQIRELVQECALKAYEGPRRVFVLDRVDVLTDSAGNALLKTLEEPAPGNVFLLVTTQRSKVLPTIASRSRPVRFAPLAVKDIVDLLEQRHKIALEKAGRLNRPLPVFNVAEVTEAAHLCGGSLSRAESYLGEDGKHLRELAESFLEAVHTDHALGRLAWAAQAATDKSLVPELLDLLGVYTRDLFARRLGLSEKSFLLVQAPKHGGGLSPFRLEAILNSLAKARWALARNAGLPLTMEVLALAAPAETA